MRDNGRGIAPTLLPHVFDLFEQGPRGLDRNQGGLGVGLTLVQRLVQLHHGAVEARSDGPGQGSEFAVRLPAASVRRPPRNRVAARTGRGRRRPRVVPAPAPGRIRARRR